MKNFRNCVDIEPGRWHPLDTMNARYDLPRNAHPLQKYKGKRYFRFTVKISQSSLEGGELVEGETYTKVIAPSAADACALVRDEIAPHVSRPTEIVTWGVKGGVTHRFIGYFSMIGAGFSEVYSQRNSAKQLSLAL